MAIYAKFDGMEGGCRQAQYTGWSDILTLEWGADRSGLAEYRKHKRPFPQVERYQKY